MLLTSVYLKRSTQHIRQYLPNNILRFDYKFSKKRRAIQMLYLIITELINIFLNNKKLKINILNVKNTIAFVPKKGGT